MKRYKHNLSNTRLTTCDMGELIPIGLTEALPGDTFQLSSSAMIRVSPLAAPVMHPVHVRIHHFFVPHRLVWPGFEDFITGGPTGTDATIPPQIDVDLNSSSIKESLWDYMGIPPNDGDPPATGVTISAVPIHGVNLIWNEYYRDQDLQTERIETDVSIPLIGWGKDYFTTARPWTQKGPDVTLPLGTSAPVMGLGVITGSGVSSNVTVHQTAGPDPTTFSAAYAAHGTSPVSDVFVAANGSRPDVFADLSAAGAININDFRRAFALQRYQEARARYGSRYTEYLRYIGVTPSDARLQRPEYLGGGTARISFSEVLQTATAERSPGDSFGVGDLYGHGVAGLRHGRIRRFIEEHGYIHSFLSVRPKGMYMNGIHRTWLRRTKEDFYQQELEQIGQQPVYKNEIFASEANGNGTDIPWSVFGYQDRYSEYKQNPSIATAEFRDLLNYWHLARDLPSSTTLNADFIKCVPTKRVFNVQTNDVLWCQIQNHVVARRKLRKSGASRIL